MSNSTIYAVCEPMPTAGGVAAPPVSGVASQLQTTTTTPRLATSQSTTTTSQSGSAARSPVDATETNNNDVNPNPTEVAVTASPFEAYSHLPAHIRGKFFAHSTTLSLGKHSLYLLYGPQDTNAGAVGGNKQHSTSPLSPTLVPGTAMHVAAANSKQQNNRATSAASTTKTQPAIPEKPWEIDRSLAVFRAGDNKQQEITTTSTKLREEDMIHFAPGDRSWNIMLSKQRFDNTLEARYATPADNEMATFARGYFDVHKAKPAMQQLRSFVPVLDEAHLADRSPPPETDIGGRKRSPTNAQQQQAAQQTQDNNNDKANISKPVAFLCRYQSHSGLRVRTRCDGFICMPYDKQRDELFHHLRREALTAVMEGKDFEVRIRRVNEEGYAVPFWLLGRTGSFADEARGGGGDGNNAIGNCGGGSGSFGNVVSGNSSSGENVLSLSREASAADHHEPPQRHASLTSSNSITSFASHQALRRRHSMRAAAQHTFKSFVEHVYDDLKSALDARIVIVADPNKKRQQNSNKKNTSNDNAARRAPSTSSNVTTAAAVPRPKPSGSSQQQQHSDTASSRSVSRLSAGTQQTAAPSNSNNGNNRRRRSPASTTTTSRNNNNDEDDDGSDCDRSHQHGNNSGGGAAEIYVTKLGLSLAAVTATPQTGSAGNGNNNAQQLAATEDLAVVDLLAFDDDETRAALFGDNAVLRPPNHPSRQLPNQHQQQHSNFHQLFYKQRPRSSSGISNQYNHSNASFGSSSGNNNNNDETSSTTSGLSHSIGGGSSTPAARSVQQYRQGSNSGGNSNSKIHDNLSTNANFRASCADIIDSKCVVVEGIENAEQLRKILLSDGIRCIYEAVGKRTTSLVITLFATQKCAISAAKFSRMRFVFEPSDINVVSAATVATTTAESNAATRRNSEAAIAAAATMAATSSSPLVHAQTEVFEPIAQKPQDAAPTSSPASTTATATTTVRCFPHPIVTNPVIVASCCIPPTTTAATSNTASENEHEAAASSSAASSLPFLAATDALFDCLSRMHDPPSTVVTDCINPHFDIIDCTNELELEFAKRRGIAHHHSLVLDAVTQQLKDLRVRRAELEQQVKQLQMKKFEIPNMEQQQQQLEAVKREQAVRNKMLRRQKRRAARRGGGKYAASAVEGLTTSSSSSSDERGDDDTKSTTTSQHRSNASESNDQSSQQQDDGGLTSGRASSVASTFGLTSTMLQSVSSSSKQQQQTQQQQLVTTPQRQNQQQQMQSPPPFAAGKTVTWLGVESQQPPDTIFQLKLRNHQRHRTAHRTNLLNKYDAAVEERVRATERLFRAQKQLKQLRQEQEHKRVEHELRVKAAEQLVAKAEHESAAAIELTHHSVMAREFGGPKGVAKVEKLLRDQKAEEKRDKAVAALYSSHRPQSATAASSSSSSFASSNAQRIRQIQIQQMQRRIANNNSSNGQRVMTPSPFFSASGVRTPSALLTPSPSSSSASKFRNGKQLPPSAAVPVSQLPLPVGWEMSGVFGASTSQANFLDQQQEQQTGINSINLTSAASFASFGNRSEYVDNDPEGWGEYRPGGAHRFNVNARRSLAQHNDDDDEFVAFPEIGRDESEAFAGRKQQQSSFGVEFGPVMGFDGEDDDDGDGGDGEEGDEDEAHNDDLDMWTPLARGGSMASPALPSAAKQLLLVASPSQSLKPKRRKKKRGNSPTTNAGTNSSPLKSADDKQQQPQQLQQQQPTKIEQPPNLLNLPTKPPAIEKRDAMILYGMLLAHCEKFINDHMPFDHRGKDNAVVSTFLNQKTKYARTRVAPPKYNRRYSSDPIMEAQLKRLATVAESTGCRFFLNAKQQMARDYVLLIDRSKSMNNGRRWKDAEEAVKVLAPHICKFDPDGITLIFFDHEAEKFDNVSDAREVAALFKTHPPRGSTDLAKALDIAFKDHFEGERGATTILVITDGAPDDREAVKRCIVEASNALGLDGELSISFVQIGNVESATQYLKELDDDLVDAQFDIVDASTADEAKNMSFNELVARSLFD